VVLVQQGVGRTLEGDPFSVLGHDSGPIEYVGAPVDEDGVFRGCPDEVTTIGEIIEHWTGQVLGFDELDGLHWAVLFDLEGEVLASREGPEGEQKG